MKIRNELYCYRRKKGLKQWEVAKAIGIERTSYLNKEKGYTEFNLSEAKRLADYLEMSIDNVYQKITTIKVDK